MDEECVYPAIREAPRDAPSGDSAGSGIAWASPEPGSLGLITPPFLTQFSSVAQSHLTLCDPMDCSTQASLSTTNSQSLLKLMDIGLVMPSNHFILCRPLLLLPSIFHSIRVLLVGFSLVGCFQTLSGSTLPEGFTPRSPQAYLQAGKRGGPFLELGSIPIKAEMLQPSGMGLSFISCKS